MPVREDWKQLAANNFRDFKLKVGGLVEKPVELSLPEMECLGRRREHHDASLHPGLVGHSAMERSAYEES